MSVFIDALSGFCKKHIFEEKLLVSPTLRVGFQLIDQIAAGDKGVLNIRIKTLRSLTLEIIAGTIAGKQLSFASSTAKELLIGELFHSLDRGKRAYLAQLKPGSGLFKLILSSIEQLEMACIPENSISEQVFEETTKGAEITHLYREYKKAIAGRKLLDYPSALLYAIDEIINRRFVFPPGLLIIVPDDMIAFDILPLEKKLLSVIPSENLIRLASDDPSQAPPADKTNLSLLRMIDNPASAPAPGKDESVSFFRAQGEANEVREIFRRLISHSIPFDQAEIVHTDGETYVPLIFEIARQYIDSGYTDDEKTIPTTFSEGISITYSKPGRALSGWLSWISEDFPQLTLTRMIKDGLLGINAGDTGYESNSAFALLLKKARIGKGKSRYIPALDSCIAGCSAGCSASLERQSSAYTQEEDTPDSTEQKNGMEKKIRAYQRLRAFIDELLAHAPDPGDDNKTIVQNALHFITSAVRCSGEFDNYARKVIIEKLTQLLDYADSSSFAFFNAMDWLVEMIHSTRAYGLGPRPGHLFVTNIAGGGYSGRPYTFIIGLDDSRFPGYRESDPILLEQERMNISAALASMTNTAEKNLMRLRRLFSRIKGNCILSFSSFDVKDGRDMFPSQALLSAFRIVSGNREADQDMLAKALSPAAAYTPPDTGDAASLDEWWLSQLCGKTRIMNTADAISIGFPFLKQGLAAAKMRKSGRFTVFDGYVPVISGESDPFAENGFLLSSNKLELLARSPLDFFFRYILCLPPSEPEEIDPNIWLDQKQKGSILHSVFQQFLSGIINKGEIPSYEKHRESIDRILFNELKREEKLNPPFSQYAYKQDIFFLQKAVHLFLKKEEDFCKQSAPSWFEVAIGMNREEGKTELDTPVPEELELAEGKSIRAVARIDRIDRTGKPDSFCFSVWDYKTGSSRKYDLDDPFRQGKSIQGILYLLLAEKRLSQIISPGAKVTEAGYFFTSLSGMGRRISWPRDILLAGKEYLILLADMIAAGSFPCSVEEDDLLYTDYKDAMIDPLQCRLEMTTKIGNQQNKALDLFRRIRNE